MPTAACRFHGGWRNGGICYNAAMLQRFLNIWRPENFHLHHRLKRRGAVAFEGWYFKLVDAEASAPLAIIPGVFLGPDAHAFVQVLDGRCGQAFYHRFPLEVFEADQRTFDVRIGKNRFSTAGLDVDLQDSDGGIGSSLSGQVALGAWARWPVTLTRPGVMGPYAFVPGMECNHGILSMDHTLSGTLSLDGRSLSYEGGRGYLEKDWGRAFPQGYVWAQSNHFEQLGVSVSASVAKIPWMAGAFRGFLVGFLHEGRLHRFTTYNGSRIERLAIDETHLTLCVQNATHRLEIRAEKKKGGVLHAPYGTEMVARVAETMNSMVYVRLTRRDPNDVVFAGLGRNGCLEMQGNLAFITDRVTAESHNMIREVLAQQRVPNASRAARAEPKNAGN